VADEQSRDQKTEEATPKRQSDAREKGQVAMSQDLVAALMLAAGIAALMTGGATLSGSVGGLIADTARTLPELGTEDLTPAGAAAIVSEAAGGSLRWVALVLLPVVALGMLVGYGQIGFVIAPKAIEPELSKLDPIKGVTRMFSLRSWVRTGQALLKIVVIASTMTVVAWTQIPNIVRMGGSELGPLLRGLGHVALRCTLGAVVAIVLIAVLDLFYQRFQHERDLRMSKEEVKEEHKTTEGDPHVRARVRRLQREAAQSRMMAEVPKSTVVVTNPDHFAVALLYERDADGEPRPPRVVAKGMDSLAQRIKGVARDAGVPCYEDVPLARALHAQVQIGSEIPEDLYAAVAAVLAYVYRMQGELVTA